MVRHSVPEEIENRSICIDGDIGAVLGELKKAFIK